MEDLQGLLEEKKNLEAKIEEWEDNNVFRGDRGFQDMLTRLSEVEEEIERIDYENNKKLLED